MFRPRLFIAVAAVGLLSLGGCVAYPDSGYYGQPAPVFVPGPIYVAPPPVYFGGGYRPYGGRPWGHGGRGHLGWR